MVPGRAGRAGGPGRRRPDVKDGLVYINTVLGYQSASAAGTGMVLTADGTVLTNNHVISGATSIKVTVLSNGRTYAATVVGTDPTDDIAVLKLTGASGLETIPLGDSSTVQLGDSVVAIGNGNGDGGEPDRVSGTITSLDEDITTSGTESESLQDLLETDADVVSGYSGGALVDDGKVVGVLGGLVGRPVARNPERQHGNRH